MFRKLALVLAGLWLFAAVLRPCLPPAHREGVDLASGARNVILFLGDGMGVSTVTAARICAAGVDGELTIARFPYTALSRTYTADYITPDSAGTMTAIMTGVNANSGVIGFGPHTERGDFNHDGDGPPLWTLLEGAKSRGMKVGVVTTARVTHATPAATYANVNERDDEAAIALQALPGDPAYNARLGNGLDILMGGGRGYFVPENLIDEEGDPGGREDGRDLRIEFQLAGYTYLWNGAGFRSLRTKDLPILGLFESGHMKFEYDRATDKGGEPSLTEMTASVITLLDQVSRRDGTGYFLMVEGGRIDHGHHDGNAFRAVTETVEFDKAIGAAVEMVDERETLIIVTADHSHGFTLSGSALRPLERLPYRPRSLPPGPKTRPFNGLFDVVYKLDEEGRVVEDRDKNGIPFTLPGYASGPGFRSGPRVDPRAELVGPNDPDYLQEAAVPLESEAHGAEDVAIYAKGPGAGDFHGTIKNTFIHDVVVKALRLRN